MFCFALWFEKYIVGCVEFIYGERYALEEEGGRVRKPCTSYEKEKFNQRDYLKSLFQGKKSE